MTDYESGMDVSRYQNAPITGPNGQIIGYKPLNYAKAKLRGVVFAGVRATVGDYYKDPCFEMNYKGYQDVGIQPIPYLVAAPADGTGRRITSTAHITWYNSLVEPLGIHGPAAVDCELDRGQSIDTITALIDSLFGLLPDPINYTRATWWDQYVRRAAHWAKIPLWIANYTNAAQPALPKDWQEWYIWQYSADGNFLGKDYGVASAHVDLNRRIQTAPAPTPAPTPSADLPITVTIGGRSYSGYVKEI